MGGPSNPFLVRIYPSQSSRERRDPVINKNVSSITGINLPNTVKELKKRSNDSTTPEQRNKHHHHCSSNGRCQARTAQSRNSATSIVTTASQSKFNEKAKTTYDLAQCSPSHLTTNQGKNNSEPPRATQQKTTGAPYSTTPRAPPAPMHK